MKRVLGTLRSSTEERFQEWNSYLSDKKKRVLGEQLSQVTVLLKSKFKCYTQALVVKLVENVRLLLSELVVSSCIPKIYFMFNR